MPLQFPGLPQKRPTFWDNFGQAATTAALRAPSADEAITRRLQNEKLQREASGELTQADLVKSADSYEIKEPGTEGALTVRVRDGDTVREVGLLPKPKTNLMEAFIQQQTVDKNNLDIASKKKDLSKIDPETAGKPDQFKVATFGRRLQQSEDVLTSLDESGFDPSSVQATAAQLSPFERLKPPEVKKFQQAKDNFINASLRRESGASISPAERASAESQYFAQDGDSPEVKAQKKANRMQVYQGFVAEAGPAWDRVPLVPAVGAPAAPKRPAQGMAGGAQADTPPAAGPGSIVVVEGKRYRVAADGDSLEPVQ